ncbi:MAG: penicillin-binding protein 1B [Methylococcaceae bacterium]|nr:penicillin-binding protein 1B [Methylococcaceae bacterium]
MSTPKKRRPSARSKPKTAKFGGFGWLRRILFILAPVVILILGGYVFYLDYTVRQQFEGKRWALPARVYASPVELYAGLEMDAADLESILEQLKYRADPALSTQASYVRLGGEITLNTREFKFWDKTEPARHMRIVFSGGTLETLEDVDEGKELSLLRLEPIQIGSFYPALKEDRILIKLDQAPKPLVNALLAVEDRDFYDHFGVSPKGIARALWADMRAGGFVQGGSTLTQQLVKNFYLNSERTLVRKLNEVIMALLLEAHYSKDEILEAYMNEIYLGQDGARAVHGFGLASDYYFSRSLDELELQHAALLVALVRGPSFYDPIKTPDKAKKRRDLVLDEMAEQAYITKAQAEQAKTKPLDVVEDPHQAISRYPAFLDLVRRQLQQEYRNEDLTSEGLRIFTTLDVEAQDSLEDSIASTLKKLDKQTRSDGALETAAVITRRTTGEIAALAGSRDPKSAGFNRAVDSVRQIGSLYKPVVYLTALSNPQKYTVLTSLQDTALRLSNPGGGAWTPKNYDGQEHGPVPLHKALAHSYNLATVRVGMGVGVAHTVKTLHNLGVERSMPVFPSTLLGVGELTPMEVAQMYQTLASDGFVTPLKAIQSVVSQDGKPLHRYGLNVKQSVDPGAVYLLDTVLQEVARSGTAKSVYSYLPADFNVAGKTGTTNDLRDSWFAGFTGDYLGVVWIGRDDNQPAKLTGAQGALQVWGSTMGKISHEPLQLDPPENVEMVWIDRGKGLRTGEGCEGATRYPFIQGSAPAGFSDCGGSSQEVGGEPEESLLKGLF